MTVYEMFTWKLPHDEPYLIVFTEEPKPATNGLAHYEVYRIELNPDTGAQISCTCVSEWDKEA